MASKWVKKVPCRSGSTLCLGFPRSSCSQSDSPFAVLAQIVAPPLELPRRPQNGPLLDLLYRQLLIEIRCVAQVPRCAWVFPAVWGSKYDDFGEILGVLTAIWGGKSGLWGGQFSKNRDFYGILQIWSTK